ncbi:hypothetical protein COHA_005859 [Chlorella ohadii]|uniref:Protein-S-isoprenylcysteine O-methyltransferase n=1 Tax=Chlorella ohadii TaxID=2649997 RepID=A0AAD5DQ70_9CHLO|nr:hypothetical protein COHA_005859 [Chlorella ohadii]
MRAIAQVLSLAAALACLILLPAYASERLGQQPLKAAASYSLYLLFFASGTISRMLRYGRLAEAQRDAQRSSGGARLALLLFAAVLVPAGHWAAWWDSSLAHLAAAAPKAAAAAASWVLPAAGYSLMLAGWALNAAAAAALGKAYNRVVAPDELVTTGPYALVQHPIYTSYMLLFAGHALSLGSPAAAALLLVGCLWYYRRRTRLEEAVLEDTFGGRYRQYRHSTGRFLPCLH